MLTRVRIEVEEDTAEACVEALSKYEHAIQLQEVRRYRDTWPITVTAQSVHRPPYPGEYADPQPTAVLEPITGASEYPTPDQTWEAPLNVRTFFNDELGREITEEVIEFDASLPGYRGRRVVAYKRLDTRSLTFLEPVLLPGNPVE